MDQTNSNKSGSHAYTLATVMAAFLFGALFAATIIFAFAWNRINTKSDELLRRFSERLDAKTESNISTFSNYYRLQADQFGSNSSMLSTQFADNLNTKANEVASRLSNDFRSQADQALAAKSTELMSGISNSFNTQLASLSTSVAAIQTEMVRPAKELATRQSTLLAAATNFASKSQPELAELCYLSAFSIDCPNSGLSIRQYLSWKEATIKSAPDSTILSNGPAILFTLSQTLDNALPASKVNPAEMENALTVIKRIETSISKRQSAQLEKIKLMTLWNKFNPSYLSNYITNKELLSALSSATPDIETTRNELQGVMESLIQTAHALEPGPLEELIPPSPKAPFNILTNWYESVLEQLHQPTIKTDAKLTAFKVLHEFTINNTNLLPCQYYFTQLDDEATKITSQQWRDRKIEFCNLLKNVIKGNRKADGETFAAGQSLLNQGFDLLRSCTNRSLVGVVVEMLPDFACDIFLLREQLIQDMIRTLPETKEKRSLARSILSGHIMSATMELRSIQKDLQLLECATSSSDGTLARLEGYLTAFEKESEADNNDGKLDALNKQREQKARYANYCRRKISSAKSSYRQAKDLASEWFRTWGNEEAQRHLRQGLEELYGIDLNSCDSGIAADWKEVESDLTSEFKGIPSEINSNTQKKSVSDFQ